MKTCKAIILGATSTVAMSLLLAGCAREISHTETNKVKSDGTVDTKEKTVTQSSDGTVTKTEESKTTRP
ncbi:MAG TPA: hypothetical protein VFE51_03255 [Verrucomicrobiae bacterium]|nr:hypothetical protein [Verrucomicrobiae bacterium]